MSYPPCFLEHAGDVFTAVLLNGVVSSVVQTPPTGSLRAQISAVIAMLVSRGETNQSYRFLSWARRISVSVAKFGWLIDQIESISAKTIEKHFAGIDLRTVVDVAERATDGALLLKVAGSTEYKAGAAASGLVPIAMSTLAQRSLPDFYFDDVSAAWLEHSAGVGTYIEERLSEAPGSQIEDEKSRFLRWAWGRVEKLRAKLESAARSGGAFTFEPWMFSDVGLLTGTATVHDRETNGAELAAGAGWSLPSSTGTVVIKTEPGARLRFS